MKPTEILENEHEAILTMLDIVEAVSKKLAAREQVPPEHLEEIVDFIRTFADRCHHGKEEDLLFKSLEEAGMPVQGGPIGVMLHEHDIGREYVGNMAGAVEPYRGGDREAGVRFAENARGYAALLSDHIYKENNVLYPMADMHLSEEEQQRLVREFERVEEERIGPGKHEEYHRLIERLKAEYL